MGGCDRIVACHRTKSTVKNKEISTSRHYIVSSKKAKVLDSVHVGSTDIVLEMFAVPASNVIRIIEADKIQKHTMPTLAVIS